MSSNNDVEGVMLSRLRHAFSTFDSASKKYISAVKEVDSSLEGIAIAFRELSQGDMDPQSKAMADRLCSAIDAHKTLKEVKKDSKGKAPAAEISANGGDEYYFSNYMSDISRDVSNQFAAFKNAVKAAEKVKDKRDDAVKSYAKLRAEVDDLEAKLAKKNKGIADDPKHAKTVAKRDEAKIAADTAELKFTQEYNAVMHLRAETLKNVVSAMGKHSARYYSAVARVMQGGA